jgi:hypothetical protein
VIYLEISYTLNLTMAKIPQIGRKCLPSGERNYSWRNTTIPFCFFSKLWRTVIILSRLVDLKFDFRARSLRWNRAGLLSSEILGDLIYDCYQFITEDQFGFYPEESNIQLS